jgi:hypothetical protein
MFSAAGEQSNTITLPSPAAPIAARSEPGPASASANYSRAVARDIRTITYSSAEFTGARVWNRRLHKLHCRQSDNVELWISEKSALSVWSNVARTLGLVEPSADQPRPSLGLTPAR